MSSGKAVYYHGDRKLQIGNSTRQTPGPDQVRVEVCYCGICGTDLHIQQGDMDSRVKIPHIIGHEMSGVVAEIGKGTTRFSVGDWVVVRPLDSCGICDACHAGYSHICENRLFAKRRERKTERFNTL